MSIANLAGLIEDMEWRKEAACRDLDSNYFFWGDGGDRGGGTAESIKRVALDTCAICPVRKACLDHALTFYEPNGIWGGLTPRQRRRLRRGAA